MSTAIVPTGDPLTLTTDIFDDFGMTFDDEDVVSVSADGVDVGEQLPGGGRIPNLSLTTSSSKILKEGGFTAGTFVVGGSVRRTAMTASPAKDPRPEIAKPILIVMAAVRPMMILSVPANAPEDAGKVLGVAFLSSKEKEPKALTECGLAVGPSGTGLVARVEKGQGKNAPSTIVGLDFPEDAVPTRDCSKCLRGLGRGTGSGEASTSSRGFLPKDFKPVDKDGKVLDLPIPENLRSPQSTDCSQVYRVACLVAVAPKDGFPPEFVPAMLTGRSSSFAAGKQLAGYVGGWARNSKAPWAHYIQLESRPMIAKVSKKDFRQVNVIGPLKKTDKEELENVKTKLQVQARELVLSLTEADWIGFMDEDVRTAESAMDEDARNMAAGVGTDENGESVY